MADEWFRNTRWDNTIAQKFEEKLRRARRKEQYIRIQASMLASVRPEVSLLLLERYFSMPDDFDHAQGYVDLAVALVTLGRIDEAVEAYEAALAREEEFPKLLTQAYLSLPVLIATERLTSRFDRAIAVLDQHVGRLMFPVDHFLWNAARSLILHERDSVEAKLCARRALAAAAKDRSGFRHHPTVGLVTARHRELLDEMAKLDGG